MTEAAIERGLSSATAAKRLRELGPPPETSSRSTSSIVAGNVFTLFNAIIGGFFVLVLSLGLFADAIFGLIAIVNSYIGIRQELKAKETLDQLAVVVAPTASARGSASGSSPAPSASRGRATTPWTRSASRATPAASPARRRRSATRP